MKIYKVEHLQWDTAANRYNKVSVTFYDMYEDALAAVTKATGRKRRDRVTGGVKDCCEFFTKQGRQGSPGYYVSLSVRYKETA